MRKITTVLVVLTVLLAGCSSGGTGGTPTTNETATPSTASGAPADTTANDIQGVTNGTVTNVSALLTAFNEKAYAGPADLRFSSETSNTSYTLRYRNDTEAQRYEVTTGDQNGTTIYYVANGTSATHNATSGETRYGSEQYRISSVARVTLATPQVFIGFAELLEWESTGTTTVDGEQRFVFESDSVNQTAAGDGTLGSNSTTADGRFTVGADGIIRSGTFELRTENDYANVTFSLSTDDSIEVTQPDWFDESEAANATAQ